MGMDATALIRCKNPNAVDGRQVLVEDEVQALTDMMNGGSIGDLEAVVA